MQRETIAKQNKAKVNRIHLYFNKIKHIQVNLTEVHFFHISYFERKCLQNDVSIAKKMF